MQTQEKAPAGAAVVAVSKIPKGVPGYGLYALVGVAVGFCSGMFGVGGGIVMVPFLVVVAGFTQQQANGISLTAMLLAAVTGAYTYFQGKTLTPAMLGVALAIGVGTIPGARMGAALAQQLPKTTLSALFALFMVIMAVRIMPAEGAKGLHLPVAGLLPSMLVLLGVLAISVGVRLALNAR